MKLFDHQAEALAGMAAQAAPLRACLYFKTGAGKTITSLLGVQQAGAGEAVVVAPPSTHVSWMKQAQELGLVVDCMSHAKFRMKDTKLSRHTAVIVDEFHLLGGNTGQGWKKLDTMARHLLAPLVILSATPNYNDAERVYCIQHVLDPHSVKGGFLQFLYQNCVTVENGFSRTPDVLGFHRFKNAAEYLSSLPYVYYLEDDLAYTITDIDLPVYVDPAFETFGYDRFSHRIMASDMEARHRRIFVTMIDPNGYLNDEAYEIISDLRRLAAPGPVLVFAAHSTVADALGKTLYADKVKHAVVTGSTPAKKKESYISAFRDGVLDVLVGTASLATGTDGLDKVCDSLVILDDTDDASLRRQLIGRIMPRGADTDASMKRVYRLVHR